MAFRGLIAFIPLLFSIAASGATILKCNILKDTEGVLVARSSFLRVDLSSGEARVFSTGANGVMSERSLISSASVSQYEIRRQDCRSESEVSFRPTGYGFRFSFHCEQGRAGGPAYVGTVMNYDSESDVGVYLEIAHQDGETQTPALVFEKCVQQ